MLCPILIQHVIVEQNLHVIKLLDLLGRAGVALITYEAEIVPQHKLQVIVAGQEPDRGRTIKARLREDWIILAHAAKDGIGIILHQLAVQIVAVAGRSRFGHGVSPLNRSFHAPKVART